MAVVLFPVPVIKIPKNRNPFSPRCPLQVLEMIANFMKSEFQITLRDSIKPTLAIELPDFFLGKVPEFLKKMLTLSKGYLMGLKVRIVFDDLKSLVF